MHEISNSALNAVSGEVSNNATWDELIYFRQDGLPMSIADFAFEFQFRRCDSSASLDLTLSTAAGDLVIADDDNSQPTILNVNVPYTRISGMCGDYRADLVSKDANNKLTHWASGVVTFTNSPIAF